MVPSPIIKVHFVDDLHTYNDKKNSYHVLPPEIAATFKHDISQENPL